MNSGIRPGAKKISSQRNTTVGFKGEGKEKTFQNLKNNMDSFLIRIKDSKKDDNSTAISKKLKSDINEILGLKKTDGLSFLNPTSGKNTYKALAIFTTEILHKLDSLKDTNLTTQVINELKKLNGESPTGAVDKFSRLADSADDKLNGINLDEVKGKLITSENRDLLQRIETENDTAISVKEEAILELDANKIVAQLKNGDYSFEQPIPKTIQTVDSLINEAENDIKKEKQLLKEFGVKPTKLEVQEETFLSNTETGSLNELDLIDLFDG